jgi:hypothetical protein
MEHSIENTWSRLDELVLEVGHTARQLTTAASRLASSVKDGRPAQAAKSSQQLVTSADQLAQVLRQISTRLDQLTEQLSEPGLLATEVETSLRAAAPSERVWTGYNTVVRWPATVRFRGSGLETHVAVDKDEDVSCRPSTIVELALRPPDRRSSERFAKSLYGAFRALQPGSETGGAPLAALFEVLAAAPPGAANYTRSAFAADLQLLYAAGVLVAAKGVQLEFKVTSAGSTAFPVVGQSGDTVNVGYVEFVAGRDDHQA